MNSERVIAQHGMGVDFGRTRWSMVVAVREGSEAQARRSLGELCRRYWVPVYVYVRRCGHSPEAAVALVQGFLSHLVTRLRADEVAVTTGFRVYLQAQLEAFLAGSAPAQTATTLVPGMEPPWPLEQIERRQREEHPADAGAAEALQRAFALEMLAIALERLRREAHQSGRSALFDAVRQFLSREPGPGEYERLAEQTGSSPLAAVIAVKRLRQRFQELIDEELAETVGDAQTLEAERHTLLTLVLRRPVE